MTVIYDVALLVAASEDAEGTFQTLTSPTDYQKYTCGPIRDVRIDVAVDKFNRNITNPTPSPFPQVIGARRATVSFTTDLFGPLNATEIKADGGGFTDVAWTGSPKVYGPPWHFINKACGQKATATATGGSEKMAYTPSLARPASATEAGTPRSVSLEIIAGIGSNSVKWKFFGCIGTYKDVFEIGKPVQRQFSFECLYNLDPSNVTQEAPSTYYSVQPPVFMGVTLQLHSNTATSTIPVKLREATIDLGNKISPRKDAVATTGYRTPLITGRPNVINLTVELEIPTAGGSGGTTYDNRWENTLKNATLGAFDLIVGSTQYNILHWAIPSLQILDAKPEKMDDYAVYKLTAVATRNTATAGLPGNDEIVFEYK